MSFKKDLAFAFGLVYFIGAFVLGYVNFGFLERWSSLESSLLTIIAFLFLITGILFWWLTED